MRYCPVTSDVRIECRDPIKIPIMINPTTQRSKVSDDISDLRLQLESGPERIKLKLIQDLADKGEAGLAVLMEWLLEQQSVPPNAVTGKAYQIIYNTPSPQANEFLQKHFQSGIVSLCSEQKIDYSALQTMLVERNFQAADSLTLQKLCELAGKAAVQRKWLYFTEVDRFPVLDLQTLDALWFVYSEGKFGFSVQRNIWLAVNKNWEKFWPKIGWKTDNNWTRYPNEFTWDLTAPKGHLPLSNQLRGVRVIAALLSHPAWNI